MVLREAGGETVKGRADTAEGGEAVLPADNVSVQPDRLDTVIALEVASFGVNNLYPYHL